MVGGVASSPDACPSPLLVTGDAVYKGQARKRRGNSDSDAASHTAAPSAAAGSRTHHVFDGQPSGELVSEVEPIANICGPSLLNVVHRPALIAHP